LKQKIRNCPERSPSGQTRAADAALKQVPGGLPGCFLFFANSPSLVRALPQRIGLPAACARQILTEGGTLPP